MHRRPLGVVGAIVPWNFPMILMAFKVPAALLVGNTMVLKPAPTTPLSTLKLAALIKDVLPPGVLNIIADAGELGAEMTAHPGIRKISYTGSTATGKKVMAGAADALKRITLELGGNDAAIVLEGSDPKEAAPKIFAGAFQNSGQVCIAIKRAYVHDSIYDAMCEELALLADERGDGRWPRAGHPARPDPEQDPVRPRDGPDRERPEGRQDHRRRRAAGRQGLLHQARPSCATSPTARGWWTRSSSARCCR